MKTSKTTTAVGIGMIAGGMPFTFAAILLLYLMAAVGEGRARGQNVGFDAIGVVMMAFFAYGLALMSCVAGLLYFSVAAQRGMTLKAWHRFGMVYSLAQVTVATICMVTR